MTEPHMPTTLPSAADRDEFRFMAVDATGGIWEWVDHGHRCGVTERLTCKDRRADLHHARGHNQTQRVGYHFTYRNLGAIPWTLMAPGGGRKPTTNARQSSRYGASGVSWRMAYSGGRPRFIPARRWSSE